MPGSAPNRADLSALCKVECVDMAGVGHSRCAAGILPADDFTGERMTTVVAEPQTAELFARPIPASAPAKPDPSLTAITQSAASAAQTDPHPVRTDRPAVQREVADSALKAEMTRIRILRWTRWIAVGITVIIALASFVLSFTTSWDLVSRARVPHSLAWLWPVIVDGTIAQSTLSVMVLGPYGDEHRKKRWFFGTVLVMAVLVSIVANALHAILPAGPLNPWLSAAIAAVAPLSALATVHGVVTLCRIPSLPPSIDVVDIAEDVDEDEGLEPENEDPSVPDMRFEGLAQELLNRGMTKQVPYHVTSVLNYTYRHPENLSAREIGQLVGISHEAVLRIQKAVQALPGGAELVRASATQSA